mgnify:CR=1 FL=1
MFRQLLVSILFCFSLFPLIGYTNDLCDSHLFQQNGCVEENSTDKNLIHTEIVDVPDFGGKVTLGYPDGWYLRNDNGTILLSNNDHALITDEIPDFDQLTDDTIIIGVFVLAKDLVPLLGIEGDVTPSAIINMFYGFLSGGDMPELTPPIEFTMNDYPTAYATGHDDNMNVTIYVLDKDGDFTFAFWANDVNHIANIDVVEAIIASVTFTPYE